MKKWKDLPESMRTEEIRKYYNILCQKRVQLHIKRIFDIIIGSVLLIIVSPIMLILSIAIKLDTPGPVMFRQVRVTMYGRKFRIFKFRTMVNGADKKGTQVTTKGDTRVTRMGHLLRGCRLDELPQLLNVITGDMSFVGTRPEVVKYVKAYTPEMRATLLMPAGITSRASIEYKDEEKLLESAEDADDVYIHQVLPEKMKYNLDAMEHFNLLCDIRTMIATVFAVVR